MIKIRGSSYRYDSGFVQPVGKFWKRQAAKKVRKAICFDNSYYKKLWGWFEWS